MRGRRGGHRRRGCGDRRPCRREGKPIKSRGQEELQAAESDERCALVDDERWEGARRAERNTAERFAEVGVEIGRAHV